VTALVLALITVSACSGHTSGPKKAGRTAAPLLTSSARSTPVASGSSTAESPTSAAVPGQLTIAFAGDVHFADRTAARLAANPATAFGESAAVLSKADLTMVNLETAIAVGGQAENKSFTFEAPPTAFTALKDAGIDVATMANNHGADYGPAGLAQTLAAIKASKFPVVGIGANAAAAYAPYYVAVNGVRLALIAASQVQDETLAHFSATDTSPGIANAYSERLISSVKAARGKADLVIVYLHWGTEYQTCPNGDQRTLAQSLALAGADAIIGTHAHVLQGAGWRSDGKYVAYGLGNYFWWMSFGNNQDDNGVLTLKVRNKRIASADFAPAHLDRRGIGLPATGATKQRILNEWEQARQCAGLLAQRPTG
jgi:hypothetical protein